MRPSGRFAETAQHITPAILDLALSAAALRFHVIMAVPITTSILAPSIPMTTPMSQVLLAHLGANGGRAKRRTPPSLDAASVIRANKASAHKWI